MIANRIVNKSLIKKRIFLVLFSLFFIICSKGYSVQVTQIKKIGSGNILGQQILLELPNKPDLDYRVEDSKLFIKLGIGEQYKLGDAFDFILTLKLHIYENGAEIAILDDIELNSSTPEAVYVYKYSNAPDNLSSVAVYIDNISDWSSVSSNSNVVNYIQSNISVELISEIDYRIDVRQQEQVVAPVIAPIGGNILSNRYQTFSWEGSEDFPNYQFELLRLYNTNTNLANKEKEIATTIDWSKALRIETQSNEKHLAITIAGGTGFYVWRVRPIGTYYKGGIADSRNWGEWSNAPAQGDKIVNLSLSDISIPYYFYFEDPDKDKNWIYSRTFSENNKVSEQISYANSLQQLRQSQTYLKSKDTTLITQTILDFSGRPSFTTIPAPVQGELQPYKSGIVTTGNELYTAEHFDNDDLIANKVDSSGVFAYYSDNNPNTSIPSAQGYPFTRVVYANDPTGRVIEQGGAGKRHAIGSQSDGMGRTTRTIYGNPSEEELIRIFGDEAPRADAVLKTTTIDPNNQASVTYTTKEGNVIATCLVVNENENMDEIDGYDPEVNEINTVIKQNTLTNNNFVSSKKLLLSRETDVKIYYNIDCKTLTFPCMVAEGDCQYQVEFLIINLETSDVYRSDPFELCGLGGNDIPDFTNDDWNTPVGAPPLNFEDGKVRLPASEYMISKVVSSGASEETFQVNTFFEESKLVIRPLINVIYGWLNSVKREEDMNNFYALVQQFGGYINSGDLNGAKLNCYDEVLGGVNLPDEFTLNPDHSIYFDQPYIPATPTEDARTPRMLTITGGCCGDIKIPVVYAPQIVCYTVQEMRDNSGMRPDFWNYIKEALYEPFKPELNSMGYFLGTVTDEQFPPEVEQKDLLIGYDEHRLNTMAYYMVTDEYTITTNDEEIAEPQYTCTEIWDAWKSVINSTIEVLNNMPPIPSVEQGSADEDAANEEPDRNSKDTHMNDKKNRDLPGGFIMRWILKKKISKRVDNFERVTPDYSGDPVEVEFDIMGEFFKQVRFRFAAILESDADALAQDKTQKDPTGVNNILYNEIDVEDDDDVNGGLPNLPYIKNPVYAFKYIHYDNNEDHGRKRHYQVEISHCFDTVENYQAIGEIPANAILCDYNCPYYNDNWHYMQRYRFYRDLVNYEYPLYLPDDEDLEENEIDDVIQQEAQDQYDEMESCFICEDSEKIAGIQAQVEQTFIDNCYSIGGCPTDSNVILQEDIDKIVEEIIQNCRDNCNAIFDRTRDNYPDDITDECWALTEEATEFMSISGKITYDILPDNEWLIYNSLKNWEVKFALDDTESLCECHDYFSGNNLNPNWHILDNDEWRSTDIYPYYYALNIDTRSEQPGEFVGVWTDAVKGDFGVSVKIKDHVSTHTGSRIGIFAAVNANNLAGEGDISLTVSNENNIVIEVDGANEASLSVAGISDSEYWLYLEKNIDDGLFYAYYKVNEDDDWSLVNTTGITGPSATDYHVGLYAERLQGADNGMGKAIFDDFNCGIIYPNTIENNEWIGGDNENYFYPKSSIE